MPNALVEQYRAKNPAWTAGKSDAELTATLAAQLEKSGQWARYAEAYPDFQRDVLALRNPGGDIAGETGAALSAGVRDRLPGTFQNFGALAADALAREELLQALGLEAPLTRAGDALRGMARENEQEAAARIAEAGGRTIRRFEDVRPTSPRDLALFLLPALAENAPSMVPGLAAGVGATVLSGGALLPGIAAGLGAGFAQNAGDVYGELRDRLPDRGRAIEAAVGAGLPMAALDVAGELLPLVKAAGLFKGVARSAVVEKLAEVAGRGGLAGAGKGAVTQALAEGGTESLQELVQIAAEEYATGEKVPDDELRSRVLNAGVVGAALGGAMGAGFGALPGGTGEDGGRTRDLEDGGRTQDGEERETGERVEERALPRLAALPGADTGLYEGVEAEGPTPVDDFLRGAERKPVATGRRRAPMLADPNAGLGEGVEPAGETSVDATLDKRRAAPKIVVPPGMTYDQAQAAIDFIEDKLEAQGINPIKLFDPWMYSASALPQGYSPMPRELAVAYRVREAIDERDMAAMTDRAFARIRAQTEFPIQNVRNAVVAAMKEGKFWRGQTSGPDIAADPDAFRGIFTKFYHALTEGMDLPLELRTLGVAEDVAREWPNVKYGVNPGPLLTAAGKLFASSFGTSVRSLADPTIIDVSSAAPDPVPAPSAAPAGEVVTFGIADPAPKRLAKTTSNDPEGDGGRGGLFAVALEKDGRVEVRNVYQRKDGTVIVENAAELVPERKVKGTGRNVGSLEAAGWKVLQAPFQLTERRKHLKRSLARAEWDALAGESRAQADAILEAINEGRGDRLIEATLRAHDAPAWGAVQFLRDAIATAAGSSPAQALLALGTRIDSVAQRDGLRAKTAAKKLAAGEVLRRQDGKVFGVFSDAEWAKFQGEVAAGRGDEALLAHFGGGKAGLARATAWAQGMAKLGAAEQAGGAAFAGKGAGELAAVEQTIDEEAAAEVAGEDGREETDDLELTEEESPLSPEKVMAGLAERGISPATLAQLSAARELTDALIHEALAKDKGFVAHVKKTGARPRDIRDITESIKDLHARSRPSSVSPERKGIAGTVRGGAGAAGVVKSQPTEGLSAGPRGLGGSNAGQNYGSRVVEEATRAIREPSEGAAGTGGAVREGSFTLVSRAELARQSARLKAWAVRAGKFFNAEKLFSEWVDYPATEATEHRVMRREYDGDDRMVKIYSGVLGTRRGFLEYFDRIRLHNFLFPDTGIRLEGVMQDGDEVKPIISQRFIAWNGVLPAEADLEAYLQPLVAYMKAKGFERVGESFSFTDGRVEVHDLHPQNWWLRPDGSVAVVDPIIRLKPGVTVDEVIGVQSRPGLENLGRAEDGEVATAWSAVVAVLADAGIDVQAVAAGIERAVGGETALAYAQRRFVRLVLKDLAQPGPVDLGVAVHEAVHVLFGAQPPEVRAALMRAVQALPDPDPATNLSLRTKDPAVYAEEKLAVSLEGMGIEAGRARGFASRLIRFFKDMYFRAARALAVALGAQAQADAFALRYFRNRMAGWLQGDYAPQSIVNALGGRRLTWAERAVLLPGFGRTIGRVMGGAMAWAPKVPNSAEAVDFNGELALSRPVAAAAMGNVENPANAIHRDVATLNHAVATERAALAAVAAKGGPLLPVLTAAANGQLDFAAWFRQQFRLENPEALKARALARVDPVTQQPVAGLNPAHGFGDFADASNAGPARIHAYKMAWDRRKAISARLTETREELAAATRKVGHAQQDFVDAHQEYLNAEGLTALVLKGVRQLLVRERKLGLRTGRQAGVVMQQLRELDRRSAATLDREYAKVFAKLFAGRELAGRNLFDLLDQMVNGAGIDFAGRTVVEIRRVLAERVAAGLSGPEIGVLVNNTPESRALLATVVAYGKTHATVLAQIERRRLKNIAERMELQQTLDKVVAERAITDQAVSDLPKTAKLEERARVLYVQEKQRLRVLQRKAAALEQRIAAAEAALPVYDQAIEGMARELGGVRPEYTFGDGMTYRVPVPGPQGVELKAEKLRLDSTGGVTDRAKLDRDLAAMTEWLALKEAAGELDADYRDLWAARQALLEGGYWESDLRKTDTWVLGNLFLPVGDKAAATGLPTGRIVQQMINRFAAVEAELRAQGTRFGDRNNRRRDAAVAVLNRGATPGNEMTADRYYAEVAEPAMAILEKSRDLLELGLTHEQALNRAYQRVLNHLLANPTLAGLVRGRETEVAKTLRAHLEGLAETSRFYHDKNQRYGLGVRDERVIVARGDGMETAGIRESLPVGLETFSRRASAAVGRAYRLLQAAGWGTFREAIRDAAQVYEQQGAAALRQKLARYFADGTGRETFVGGMAETDTFSPFDAPVLPDGVTRPEADPAKAAAAWRTSGGDVVAFAEALYDLHGGQTGKARYVQEVLERLAEYHTQLGTMLEPAETGAVPEGLGRLTPNLMIDARVLDRWPTAWTEHLFFDLHTNHQLARRVAGQVAFGRDTERLAQVWGTLERELDLAAAAHEEVRERGRRLGLAGKDLDRHTRADYERRLGAGPGAAEYARVERLVKLRPAIQQARENVRLFFSTKHNQLDAPKLAAQLGQTVAFGMLNNPGTALLNLADLFSPLLQSGVSTSTLRQVLRNWKHLGQGVAGSLAQAVGYDLLKSSRLQATYVEMGLNDPAVALQYLAKTEDGWRSDLTADHAARGREELAASRALRIFTRALGAGITPTGEKARFTALRPLAPFQSFVLETMRASTLSTWQRVEDMVAQGVRWLDRNPVAARDPNFRLTAAALGLQGEEAATFETYRRKLAEGYGLELTGLARAALERRAGAPGADADLLLDRKTRAVLQGMVANELILEGNLATMTPKAWTSSFARFVLPLWGWPIRRALQVARVGLDSEDTYRAVAVARGLAALGVMAAAGMAMALLTEEYHERIVGRKRNLRSVKGLPGELERGQAGEAMLTVLENVNRAGTFGLWGEVLNTAVNGLGGGGDNRTLSFDQRVVMANSLLSLGRSIATVAAQGDVDYAGVVRPTAMALGGNSALQYLQIGNRALGLDNAEARFVERLDAQNRLRVAGRELGLEVRTGSAAHATPTPLTPHISRMVLAAYGGDRADFLAAWRAAVKEAQAQGKADPVGYVRESFASRHPLKNVFRTVSQGDYAKILRHLDEAGRREVRGAVDRFNAYAESLDARAYTGAGGERGRARAGAGADPGRLRLGF